MRASLLFIAATANAHPFNYASNIAKQVVLQTLAGTTNTTPAPTHASGNHSTPPPTPKPTPKPTPQPVTASPTTTAHGECSDAVTNGMNGGDSGMGLGCSQLGEAGEQFCGCLISSCETTPGGATSWNTTQATCNSNIQKAAESGNEVMNIGVKCMKEAHISTTSMPTCADVIKPLSLCSFVETFKWELGIGGCKDLMGGCLQQNNTAGKLFHDQCVTNLCAYGGDSGLVPDICSTASECAKQCPSPEEFQTKFDDAMKGGDSSKPVTKEAWFYPVVIIGALIVLGGIAGGIFLATRKPTYEQVQTTVA